MEVYSWGWGRKNEPHIFGGFSSTPGLITGEHV